MTSLMFLGLALLISIVGSGVLFFFYRERNTTFESSIDRHQREMDALSGMPKGRRRR